jgi:hypothetical protein
MNQYVKMAVSGFQSPVGAPMEGAILEQLGLLPQLRVHFPDLAQEFWDLEAVADHRSWSDLPRPDLS